MINNLEFAAEKALQKLREVIPQMHDLELQCRAAEHNLKHLEGKLCRESNQPVTIRTTCVRGSESWKEAADKEAEAKAALAEARAYKDHCETVISLYQSELRERRS